MQNSEINTDKNGKELNEHGNLLFPLAAYDERFSEFILKEVPWHWHPEIEIVYVVSGATKVHYLDGSKDLHTGELIYVNGNVLHRLTQIGEEDCRILNFVLDPVFVGGKSDSLLYQRYVRPIYQDKSIMTIKLTHQVPWEKNAIEYIKRAFEMYESSEYGKELLVRAKLTEFWSEFSRHVREDGQYQELCSVADQRISEMIKFVHRNISEKLSVRMVANASNVSESECFRLFRSKLDMTPIEYINNHRLQCAASRLMETSDEVLTIALDLGFNSPSYFSKKFKQTYNLTPVDFRSRSRSKTF